jgi:hypothetical protein
MKRILLQYWEESERGWGIRPDGASLHKDIIDHKNYVDSIYNIRESTKLVPDEYDRVVGDPIFISVNEDLFNLISTKSVRLTQYQLNNLIKTKDIILND